MAGRNSLLVGQIALEMNFLTEEKLQECLVLQAGQVKARPIGTLLVENGFLTDSQLSLIMQEQARRLRESVPYAEGQREEVSFGKLLVKAGFTSPERVNEALRAQQDLAERGVRKRLGELLVDAGHIAPETVQAVLRMQGKVLLACTFCGAHYNVLECIANETPCRKCGMPLGHLVGTVSVEDSVYLLPAVQPLPGDTPKRPVAAVAASEGPSRPGTKAEAVDGKASARLARQAALVLTVLGALALVLLFLSESSAW